MGVSERRWGVFERLWLFLSVQVTQISKNLQKASKTPLNMKRNIPE